MAALGVAIHAVDVFARDWLVDPGGDVERLELERLISILNGIGLNASLQHSPATLTFGLKTPAIPGQFKPAPSVPISKEFPNNR